eukprot:TRINITY_DN6045_c0_g2_i1.p1 TRINITY_DN6045_c0_g2~~TRINITY_DN6045_c0_g2_i1.p1  ORF type:complete len:919 (+),score=271.48 TRINITY_DN6045_c0_g2_i1:119-2875(+)
MVERQNKHKLQWGLLIGSIVLDLASSILIQVVSPSGGEFFNFQSDYYDLLLAAAIKAVLIPVTLWLGIRYGKKDIHFDRWKTSNSPSNGIKNKKRDESEMGLLADTKQESEIQGSRRKAEQESESEAISAQLEDRAIAYAKYGRYISSATLFLLITGCQVFLGVKVISFQFDASSSGYFWEIFFTFALIFWMNIQLYTSRELLDIYTQDIGLYSPVIHIHPLNWIRDATMHRCDLCYKRIQGGGSYRCNPCRFDLCESCAKKVQDGTVDGVLRTDRGPKKEVELSNWEYIKKSLVFARSHMMLLSLAIVFLIGSSLTNILLPNYQGLILNDVIAGNRMEFKGNIMRYLFLSLALGIFSGIRSLCFGLVGKKMLYDVQGKLVQSIFIQDVAFFDGISTGDLTTRIWSDSNSMLTPINSVLTSFLSALLALMGGLVMCLYTSWRLSVLALTTIGPITLLFRIYSTWSRDVQSQIWKSMALANSMATEGIKNIRTVRAFSQEGKEEEKYRSSRQNALQKGIQDAFVGAGTTCLTSYMDLSIGILILWYGGTLVMDFPEILAVGNLITFQLYWNMIATNFNTLTGFLNSFTKAGSAAQRVLGLMDLHPDIDPGRGKIVTKIKGDIELKDVEFTYQLRPDNQVLKGFNLKIGAGQVCALVGRSGAGKSTLIHMLMRFYDPHRGKILLDGTDLRDLNPKSFREHIGIVSQETQLFNGTIEENIAYGVGEYTEEELLEASQAANVHQFVMEFSEKYQTKVGEQGQRLSGGQKQRIALARCFLKAPSLLFLDEATSALDAESEAMVQEGIDKLISKGGSTVVLVAHRLSTVINADTIAVVDDGRVVEQGNHDTLLQQGGIYARLVQRQLAKMQNTLPEDAPSSGPVDVIDALLTNETSETAPEQKLNTSSGSGRGGRGRGRGNNQS